MSNVEKGGDLPIMRVQHENTPIGLLSYPECAHFVFHRRAFGRNCPLPGLRRTPTCFPNCHALNCEMSPNHARLDGSTAFRRGVYGAHERNGPNAFAAQSNRERDEHRVYLCGQHLDR